MKTSHSLCLFSVGMALLISSPGSGRRVTVVAQNPLTGVVTTNLVPHYSTYRKVACEWCGKPTAGNVHHIIPQSTALSLGMPELIHDPRNLVTLCPHCHVLIGHLGNTSRDNNELAEMLRVKHRLESKKEDGNEETGDPAGIGSSNRIERVSQPEQEVEPLPDQPAG